MVIKTNLSHAHIASSRERESEGERERESERERERESQRERPMPVTNKQQSIFLVAQTVVLRSGRYILEVERVSRAQCTTPVYKNI